MGTENKIKIDTNIPIKLHWIHWSVIGLSLLLTLSAWRITDNQTQEKLQIRFKHHSEHIVELIRERLQKYEDALAGGVSTFNSIGRPFHLNEWVEYTQSLKLHDKYPGINGMGFIHYIPQQKLSSYLKEKRKERPGYKVFPKHKETEYWPITYVEPYKDNSKAVGLDMAHETNRYTAAKKARDAGTAQITGPITLVQDSEKTPGFLFYTPYYNTPNPQSLEEKRKSFVGLVYAPFVMKKLMEGVLQEDKRFVAVKISDKDKVLYDELSKTEFEKSDFVSNKEITFYGRTWSIKMKASPLFTSSAQTAQPLLILFGGLIIDALLLMLMTMIVKSNNRAINIAKSMAKEADEQRIAVIHSAKMSSLGEMAGGVAHEVNNPLAIIHGYVSLLRKQSKKDNFKKEDVEEFADKTLRTIKRIKSIIDGLRKFSRDGTHDKMEECTSSDVINDALEFCKERFDKHGIEIRLNTTQETTIKCRKIEISQVLINLLNNAKHAVEDNDNPWVEIQTQDTGSTFEIRIIDSGKGISKEIVDKLFVPFFTTKEVGKGTGLGLSISKGIVDKHGGRLSCDHSHENTCFVLSLPKAETNLKAA